MKTEEHNKIKPYGKACRSIAILLFILTLCGTVPVILQRPHALLGRAKVALTCDSGAYNWRLIGVNDGVPIIATLSDTNWLVGQLDTLGEKEIQYTINRLEFKTRRRFANTHLASILNQSGGLVGDIDPSPDGKWLIGTLLASSTSTDRLPESPRWRIATAIDGSRIRRWSAKVPNYANTSLPPGVNVSYIAWMPDSQNVAEIVTSQSPSGTLRLQGTLHDVYSSHTSKIEFSAPSLPAYNAQLAIRPGVLLLSSVSNYDQSWTTPVRRILRFDFGRKIVKPTAVDLYAWPLRQSGAVAQISHLSTPPGTWLVGLAFSPNGQHIAWEVTRESYPSVLERLVYYLFRRPMPTPSAQIELWTSDIRGSGKKMVGYLPHIEKWDNSMSLHLSWLPSGKEIRFFFAQKIYTVRAEISPQ